MHMRDKDEMNGQDDMVHGMDVWIRRIPNTRGLPKHPIQLAKGAFTGIHEDPTDPIHF